MGGSGNGSGGGFSEIRICPRCGRPVWNVEVKHIGGKTYYYAVHREVLPDGKVKFIYHYLGPKTYTYVKKTHDNYNIDFYGAIEDLEGGASRATEYLERLALSIRQQIEASTLPSRKALELAGVIEKLARLAGELRQYAEIKAKAEAEEAKERPRGD
ncbi:MAG: hypothetical protein RXR21_04740 [Nitrososphaeria archaeon]